MGACQGEADLVSYFIDQARQSIADGTSQRAGLLATQAIRSGASRRVLERIKATGDLFMAWANEPWVLNGADVRISLIGFDDGREEARTLEGRPVATINADLTGSLDLTAATTLAENRGVSFMGDTMGGPFDVAGELARRWLALPLNPNGRPNADVVRLWANGMDITRRTRDVWIVNFGTSTPVSEAMLYEAPFEHVRRHILPERATNNRAALHIGSDGGFT